MKHEDFNDKHLDTRKSGKKHKKKFVKENVDVDTYRSQRVSFKSYLRTIEDELLEDVFDDD